MSSPPEAASPTPTWRDLFRGRHAVYSLILTLAISLHAVDVFIIATVLPSVVAEIGGAAFYTWSTMLYMVASIVGAASGGRVKVNLGNRYGYVAASGLFLLGTVGCAMAPTMPFLLAARVFQGLGGGLIVSLSYTLIGSLYPQAMRARMFAVISAMWGIAAVLGPMIGGVFAEIGWWRGAFWVGVPVILLFSSLAWRVLPDAPQDGTPPRFPWRRLALLAAGVLCVALSGHVDAIPAKFALLVLAAAVVALTFHLDAKGPENRLFPSRPMSVNHPVSVGYWMVFLFSVTYSPISVFIPLLLQVLHGVGPLAAGYFFAIMAFGWTLAAMIVSGFEGRRVQAMILLGPITMTVGIAGQSLVVEGGSLLLLGLFVAMVGVGVGMCHAHIANLTITAARPSEEAVTASSIPMTQSLGTAFGAAAGGLVANAAGLNAGVSAETVGSAASWIYGFCIVPPAIASLMAIRLLWLHRARESSTPHLGT